MIFVTLGTQKFQMNRLLKNIDDLINSGKLQEEVFAQTGNSDYKPIGYQTKEFLNGDEFRSKIEECSLVITHSGVGTIMEAVKCDKKVLVCPRLSKYGEHVDDHQKEIAYSFKERKYVCVCDDKDDLYEKIQEAKNMQNIRYTGSPDKIQNLILSFIDQNF